MSHLYITKDKRTGVLIYASSDMNYAIKKTEDYFSSLSERREFVVDVVIYVEPKKDEII